MANIDPIPPSPTRKEILRFWSRVDKTPGLGPKGDCWEWRRVTDKGGYGRYSLGTTRKYRQVSASRLSYFLTFGVWPELLVCHHCDNPRCVNPSHLFEGTSQDNATDMVLKGRKSNTKLTAADVVTIRALYASGGYTLREIGRIYQVSFGVIHGVVRRNAWRHV